MPLSAGADQNQTTSRILNRLGYAMTDVAADITTAATGDIILMLDASDNYEVKYADSANVFELMGITSSAAELNITDGMLATAAEVNRVADVSTRIVTLVASGAISLATHEGKTLLLGEVGGNALCALTLPAATGSGAKYLFKVSVVNTSNYTITTDGTDVFKGTVLSHDRDITDGTLLHAFATTAATIITLNGGTTGGGTIGDWIEIEDILTATWAVRGILSVPAGSNPATCFS